MTKNGLHWLIYSLISSVTCIQ